MGRDSAMTVSRWRRRLGGIRARIVISYVMLFGAALVIVLVVVRQALLARVDADVDRRLAAEVAQLELVIRAGDPETGEQFDDAETLFDVHLRQVLPGDDQAFYTLVDGEPFLLSFDAPADLLADDAVVDAWGSIETSVWQGIDSDAGRARVLVVPIRLGGATNATFAVAEFTDTQRDDVDDVVALIAVVGGVVLIVTALLGWSLAGPVVRPIRDLTTVARTINESDLSARIPVDGDDEVAELSRTFNDMVERLDDSFRQQREFLDDVAHELRTPITIVQGHLDVLDDDEHVETLEIVADELERMNRYVSDLLVLAQAERPDFLRLAPVDLEAFTMALLSKVSGLGERSWVRDVLPADELPVVELDEQRIMQAMLNLAHNAVRHTEPGDEVGIGVDYRDGRAVMWIRDTGAGIEPEILDRLFTRHVRSASSRTSGGSGIGLSIVDTIAVAHGGEVKATSASGRGATFVIEVPASATTEEGQIT